MYRVRVWSRHPSHRVLRDNIGRLPVPSVVRLGSVTQANFHCIEINSIESVKISADKKLMKEKFDEAVVKTAPWVMGLTVEEILSNLTKKGIEFPIIAKSRNGSRGVGNTLIDDKHNLKNWANGRELDRYIFEKYLNYSLEYRLHITKDGCFYTCRKALKKNGINKWQRHVDNTTWYLETNEKFYKPNSWNDIVTECVKALKQIGADVLSFDVKVQSAVDKKTNETRKYQNFFLIESNSASSMASNNDDISICAQRYLDILPKLIMDKGEVK